MGERRVITKYYPPDFDAEKIPRRKQPKQMKIRMMLPMSIRCNTCGTYIYKGTKFNSRMEDVGETYLGIQVFRFYFKCTRCSAELTMKTDPQNSDYVVESGATLNFEPWRAEDEAVDREKRKRDAEEMGVAMKSLENRANDLKQDMDILAALEEMKSMKSRHATVSMDEMLEELKHSSHEKDKRIMEEMDKADEELIKSVVFPGSKDYIRRRIQDDEDEDLDEDILQASTSLSGPSNNALKGKGTSENVVGSPTNELLKPSIVNSSKKKESTGGSSLLMPKVILKPRSATEQPSKKPRTGSAENPLAKDGDSKNNESAGSETKNGLPKDGVSKNNECASSETTTGLLSLCQNYDSDESG